MNGHDHILWQEEYVDWRPLQGVLPDEQCGDWMWMHAVDDRDGERVHFYKHIMTRRYVRLDRHGNLYREDEQGYPYLVTTDAHRRKAALETASSL